MFVKLKIVILYLKLTRTRTRSPCVLRVNSPRGEAKWVIDPWPSRAKGLIVLVSPN